MFLLPSVFFSFISSPFLCISFSFASCSFPIPLFLSSLSLFLYFLSLVCFVLFLPSFSLFESLSLSSLFSVSPVFFFFPCSRLVEWGIYMIGEARATLPLSNHGDKVEWLHGVAFVQSLQPESMTSLSNLHHGGK